MITIRMAVYDQLNRQKRIKLISGGCVYFAASVLRDGDADLVLLIL